MHAVAGSAFHLTELHKNHNDDISSHLSDREQVGQLSQPNRTAACISLGKNISAKCVHLTSFYPTPLTSTNDHLTVFTLYLMQNYATFRR